MKGWKVGTGSTYEPEQRKSAKRATDASERHAPVFFVESPGGIPRFRTLEIAIPPQDNENVEAGTDWHFSRSVQCTRTG